MITDAILIVLFGFIDVIVGIIPQTKGIDYTIITQFYNWFAWFKKMTDIFIPWNTVLQLVGINISIFALSIILRMVKTAKGVAM